MIITLSIPETIKEKGVEKAKKDYKSFSGYVKDLIINDLKEK